MKWIALTVVGIIIWSIFLAPRCVYHVQGAAIHSVCKAETLLKLIK